MFFKVVDYFVCLLAGLLEKSYEQILMRLFGRLGYDPGKDPEHFSADLGPAAGYRNV